MLLVAFDFVLIGASLFFTWLIDPFAVRNEALPPLWLIGLWMPLSIPQVAILYLIGLYDFRSLRAWQPVFPTLLGLAIFVTIVVVILLAVPVGGYAILRLVIVYMLFLTVLLVSLRMLILANIAHSTRRPKMLILVWSDRSSRVAQTLGEFSDRTFDVARVVMLDTANATKMLLEAISDKKVDVIALELSEQPLADTAVSELLRRHLAGTPVYDLPAVYAVTFGRVPLDCVDARWLVTTIARDTVKARYFRAKRLMDLLVSMVALFMLSPIAFLIAIFIKLDSAGGVFFRQERLGHNRVPFTCLKFRTMRTDAEALTGPVWSQAHDPRITRIGRFLRATRLDEVPQFINVFRGDMTLVGPRPIREHFARVLEQQIPFYDIRFTVKPGVTGWAQVNHGYAGSEEDQRVKFEYELFYLQSFSLLMDAFILFKTLRSVLSRSGQ
jgi:exopolysaccharide biosynthesis polyprenyl glycosylphosphotransferase